MRGHSFPGLRCHLGMLPACRGRPFLFARAQRARGECLIQRSNSMHRHCERHPSNPESRVRLWICFVARAPRNDGETRVYIPAAGFARVLLNIHPREKQRAQGMPGAGCTRSHRAVKVAQKRALTKQVQPRHPGIPCAVVYGLLRALPGEPACLPPSPLRSICSAGLGACMGAPEPHDFILREDGRSSHDLIAFTASRTQRP